MSRPLMCPCCHHVEVLDEVPSSGTLVCRHCQAVIALVNEDRRWSDLQGLRGMLVILPLLFAGGAIAYGRYFSRGLPFRPRIVAPVRGPVDFSWLLLALGVITTASAGVILWRTTKVRKDRGLTYLPTLGMLGLAAVQLIGAIFLFAWTESLAVPFIALALVAAASIFLDQTQRLQTVFAVIGIVTGAVVAALILIFVTCVSASL